MQDHAQLFFKPGLAPTSINEFFEKPALFWKHSSMNPNRVKKEATEPMIFGRLVHCLVLTPEQYEKDFLLAPVKTDQMLETVDDMKKLLVPIVAQQGAKIDPKAKKDDLKKLVRSFAPYALIWDDVKERAEATAKERRMTLITDDQLKLARSMQDAMMSNRAVKDLIGNGLSEEPFCWWPEGEGNGIMRKVKMDYLRAGLVIEFKTDADPGEDSFSRTMGQRGYHRQLADQVEAATRKHGEAPRGAIVIAQDKEFHDDIAIYAVEAQALAKGRAENDWAYGEIKRRMAENDWRRFPQQIMPIGLQRWYKTPHGIQV